MGEHQSKDTDRSSIAARTYLYTLELVLEDLQRLRRRLVADEYATHLLDRVHGNLETLDAAVWPTAGELHRSYFAICGDHDIASQEAVQLVDRRGQHIRSFA